MALTPHVQVGPSSVSVKGAETKGKQAGHLREAVDDGQQVIQLGR